MPELIPQLYYFDRDQTHNLVCFENVHPNAINFIEESYKGRFIKSSQGNTYNLIQQYSPNSNYDSGLWIENFFPLLRLLSKSGFIVNQHLVTIRDPISPLNYSLPSSFKVKVNPKSQLLIEYLRLDTGSGYPFYLDETYRHPDNPNYYVYENVNYTYLYTIGKFSYFNPEDKTVEIDITLSNYLVSSLVITNGTLSDKSLEESMLLVNVNEVVSKSILALSNFEKYIFAVDYEDNWQVEDKVVSIEIDTISDNWYWACVIWANNNHWKQSFPQRSNLGKRLKLKKDSLRASFDIKLWDIEATLFDGNKVSDLYYAYPQPPIYSGVTYRIKYQVVLVSLTPEEISSEDFEVAVNIADTREFDDFTWKYVKGDITAESNVGYIFKGDGSITLPKQTWDKVGICVAGNFSVFVNSDRYIDEFIPYIKVIFDSNPSNINVRFDDLLMSNSIMLQEIHAALDAGKYAVNPANPDVPRVWNLGMQIHALTMNAGLNIAPDGSPRSITDSKLDYEAFEDGDTVSDRYGQGQAGIEYRQLNGEITPCPGFLYDVLTPQLKANPLTGEVTDLGTGGMIGCSSSYQLLQSALRDFAKAIGVDMAVGVIPAADGLGYVTYEGLMDVATESLFMHSYESMIAMKTFINSQKGVAMLQELMRGMGIAIEPKSFNMTLLDTPVQAVYPGIADASPSLADLICLLLLQLCHLLPQTMSLPAMQKKTGLPTDPGPDTETDPNSEA